MRVTCSKCGNGPLAQWFTLEGVDRCEACTHAAIDAAKSLLRARAAMRALSLFAVWLWCELESRAEFERDCHVPGNDDEMRAWAFAEACKRGLLRVTR